MHCIDCLMRSPCPTCGICTYTEAVRSPVCHACLYGGRCYHPNYDKHWLLVFMGNSKGAQKYGTH